MMNVDRTNERSGKQKASHLVANSQNIINHIYFSRHHFLYNRKTFITYIIDISSITKQ